MRIEEHDEAAVSTILAGVMPVMLVHYRLKPGPEIVPLMDALCRSELPSRRFPDKAFDGVDRACAEASLAGATRLEKDHIRGVIADLAGMSFAADSP